MIALLVLNKQKVKYLQSCVLRITQGKRFCYYYYLLFFLVFYLVANISRDYIPKPTFSTVMVELSKLCLIVHAGSENYVLLANQDKLLWECHCWSEKLFTPTQKTLIPFCQRVVLACEAEFVGQQIFTQGDDESADEAEQKDEKKKIHESNMSSGNVYINNSSNI